MTAIYIAAYIFGLWHVINLWMEFFDVDHENFYSGLAFENGDYVQRPRWQKFILKPLYYCMPCMCSVHGTFCYFLLIGGASVAEWIWSCVVAAGIVMVVNRTLDRYEI